MLAHSTARMGLAIAGLLVPTLMAGPAFAQRPAQTPTKAPIDRAWSPVDTIRRTPTGTIRDVTGGRLIRIAPQGPQLAAPRRLPSRARVSVAVPAPKTPDRFHRVVFEDAGHFRSDGRVIALAGLVALAPDAVCEAGAPCGRRAVAAVRRFVRARSLDCAPLADDAPPDAPRLCHVGPIFLNAWIVGQGWAEASEDADGQALEPFEAEAEAAGRGLHAAGDGDVVSR